ncbi:MAG: DUF3750 domain-containing protein [Cyanobacteria bacterium J06626_14]
MTTIDSPIIVELWAARVPYVGRIADHHWLIIYRPDAIDRWEVWQKSHCCKTSWGHLHLNLLPPTSGVGNGGGRQLSRWSGQDATRLAQHIESAPKHYPWTHHYWLFPGPNSNTFVQWVLQDLYPLGWRGIGRTYARWALPSRVMK